ncbi:MAG TPA: hypothetical protein VGA00_02220 [Acidiferrobacterales bacterium]|jgi:hypothetical protein
MELSDEDHLRLNVLLQNVEAVRIDEQAMVVCGLSPRGEARVPLNPTCRDDKYLKLVREFLSGAALGSPRGYPLHLERWTRMGQTKDTYLAELLMLGEPEAVAAVVCAEGLTDELARRAWWAAPTAENACHMLRHACVVQGRMGRVLVDYLVEHLPFETTAGAIIRTVRLLLQSGLLDAPIRQRLWERGAQKNAYRIGFLAAVPDDLPERQAARADLPRHAPALASLARQGNAAAGLLAKLLDSPGQGFLHTCEAIVTKIGDQDAVVALFNLIGDYFAAARAGRECGADFMRILAETRAAVTAADDAGGAAAELRALRAALPELEAETVALGSLARVSETLLNPIFAKTTASGSLMRRKLEPITQPIVEQFGRLRRAPGG